ncbi:uncharacterized protein LOC133523880 [Cydia pomonella]|uniref:uncharacterized protein LOC133523880 n=1 Tax=Cydia pomonella TaxID=82600 RepID=UPI002ADDB8F6|nr:uncharacterized protein LOC133523880 [Cydia pomonella]
MGDFNTDLLKFNNRSRKLHEIVESAGLNVLPLNPTHHNCDASDSWLDLILTSSKDLVDKVGQFTAPAFSHHDLIFMSYRIRPPKPQSKFVQLRSFARLDIEALKRDACAVDWTPVYAAPSVDEGVALLNKAVLKLYDTHAPVCTVKLKRPPAPWITRGVRMAMARRDRAFRKYKRSRCDEDWQHYKAARNRCNRLSRSGSLLTSWIAGRRFALVSPFLTG